MELGYGHRLSIYEAQATGATRSQRTVTSNTFAKQFVDDIFAKRATHKIFANATTSNTFATTIANNMFARTVARDTVTNTLTGTHQQTTRSHMHPIGNL